MALLWLQALLLFPQPALGLVYVLAVYGGRVQPSRPAEAFLLALPVVSLGLGVWNVAQPGRATRRWAAGWLLLALAEVGWGRWVAARASSARDWVAPAPAAASLPERLGRPERASSPVAAATLASPGHGAAPPGAVRSPEDRDDLGPGWIVCRNPAARGCFVLRDPAVCGDGEAPGRIHARLPAAAARPEVEAALRECRASLPR